MALDNQQAYEIVRGWIGRPGATKAFDEDLGSCVYRRDDGNLCAIGGLLLGRIPSFHEMWDEGDEGVRGLIEAYPSVMDVLAGVNVDLLEALQRCHDAERDDEGWQERTLLRIDETALRYGLTPVA